MCGCRVCKYYYCVNWICFLFCVFCHCVRISLHFSLGRLGNRNVIYEILNNTVKEIWELIRSNSAFLAELGHVNFKHPYLYVQTVVWLYLCFHLPLASQLASLTVLWGCQTLCPPHPPLNGTWNHIFKFKYFKTCGDVWTFLWVEYFDCLNWGNCKQ